MGNTFQMKLTNTEFIKIVRSTEIRHIRELSLAITSIKISVKSFSREKDLSTSHYGIYIMCGEYVLFFLRKTIEFILSIFFLIQRSFYQVYDKYLRLKSESSCVEYPVQPAPFYKYCSISLQAYLHI